jgi:hypothetical protein
MAMLGTSLRQVCSLLLLFVAAASALKFDLVARPHNEPRPWRCIRNFVAKDTLVVVTATVSGYRGDGMIVNMHVSRTCRTRIQIGRCRMVADKGCHSLWMP